MKFIFQSIFALLILFTCSGSAFSQTEIEPQVTPESLKAELTEQFEDNALPGMALTIVKDGKVVFQEAFGHANVAADLKYSNSTIQPIGSISKTFIAVAIMKAIELGHFELDTQINDILPFKVSNPHSPETAITIRHLVTHTSGIIDRDDFYFTCYRLAPNSDATTDAVKILTDEGVQTGLRMPLGEMMKAYLSTAGEDYQDANFLEIKAGDRSEYSNLGSSLAAYLIEAKTGTKYSQFVQEHIFDPLEMSDTRFVLDTEQVNGAATLYFANDQPFPNYVNDSYPDGAVQSSNRDMSKYILEMIQAFHGESKILKRESMQIMFQPLLKEGTPGQKGDELQAVFWTANDSRFPTPAPTREHWQC